MEDVPNIIIGGVAYLGELHADDGEEVVDVEDMEYLLVDDDKDETEDVVEAPLEGAVCPRRS